MQQEYKDKLREVVKSMAEQGYEQSEIERIIKRYNKRYNEYDLPGQVKPQKQKPVSTDTTTADPGKEDAQQQTSEDAAAGQDNTASTSETTSSESQEDNQQQTQEPEVSKAAELAELTDKDFISQIKELNPALGAAEFMPAGIFAGNAVRVKLPGQDSVTIDLRAFTDKGSEEAQAQIQQLLDYENEKGGALNVANLDRDFNVDIPAFNDAYKGTGFTLNTVTRLQQNQELQNIKDQGGDARNSDIMNAIKFGGYGSGEVMEVLNDNGERVWVGRASQLNDWLNTNLSEDQVNVVNSNLTAFASSEINERNKMMEDRQKNEEFSRKSTDLKYIEDKEFGAVNNLQGNLGFTLREAQVINDFIKDNPEVLKNPELLDKLELDYGQGRFSPTGNIEHPDVDASINQVKELIQSNIDKGLYETSKEQYRNDIIDDANQGALEKRYKKDTQKRRLAKASAYTLAAQDEQAEAEMLERSDNLVNSSEQFDKDFKSRNNIIISDAKKDGVTSVEYDENLSRYIVEADNPDIASYYTKKLNNSLNLYKKQNNDLQEESNSIRTQLRELSNKSQDENFLSKYGEKDFNLRRTLASDFGASFESMVLDVPILFGSDAALERKNSLEAGRAATFETMKTFDQVEGLEDSLIFGLRTASQQAAPVITAIAAGSLGVGAFGAARGAVIAENATAAFYGITSAGSKLGEIKTMEDAAKDAQAMLDKLNPKDFETEAEYLEVKGQLEATISEGSLTMGQKVGAVALAGIVEGGVTRFFGTIPNSSKALKNFLTPVDDISKAFATNNIRAGLNAFGTFGKRVGSEIIEEELILLGNVGIEAGILGKEADFSQWDDTLVSSLIIAGPMNGPGIAYSTVMTQMATAPIRQEYKAVMDNINDIDSKLKNNVQFNEDGSKNPDYESDRKRLQDAKLEEYNKLGLISNKMEAGALALGSDKLKNLIINQNQLNALDRQAGVDPTMSEGVANEKRDAYAKSLGEKKGADFLEKVNDIKQAREKILGKIDYTNAPNKVYGEYGDVVLNKLISENPGLKSADFKTQFEVVHDAIKQERAAVAEGNARNNERVVEFVEDQIYGMPWSEAKERGFEKREDLEKSLYGTIGKNMQSASNQAITLAKDNNVSAASVLQDTRLEDITFAAAQDSEDLRKQVLQGYENKTARQISELDSSLSADERAAAESQIRARNYAEAEAIIQEINEGETNGVIIDNKYIVTGGQVNAAQQALSEGNLLAGTVVAHEVSHAVDSKAFTTTEQQNNYALNLAKWSESNIPTTHNNALNRLQNIGVYNPNNSLDNQSDLFYKEYAQSIQDELPLRQNRKDLNKLNKVGQSIPNMLGGVLNKDYKISTPRDAAAYLGNSMKAFKDGKLGDLQKRRIDNAQEQRNKEGVSEATRRSANSPILHNEADATGKAANALFDNRNTNPDYRFDIANLYDGMIIKWLESMERNGWNLGEGDLRADNINDVLMNVKLSSRGLHGLIQKYVDTYPVMVDVKDPKTGETVQEPNTVSKFLNGVLSERLKEKFVLEGTTINPGNIKVDLDNAAELVSTEKADKLINEVTQEASNQFDTPLLDQLNFTQDMIDDFRSAVAKTVGVKLPALDAKQGKNQSISPLIRELKKQFGVKNGPLHNVVKQLMGKTKAEVESFLTDPANKKAILDAMTTTWLASNLPMAVEKKVRGIGYTTDHVGRKKGTKPGDIEAWNASEEGPYKGMTDGKQKIRRNPKAAQDVTNAEMLSKFAKGETMTDMKRSGLEKLQLAMAQELGLEMFKADLLNDGELAEIFKGRQELFDRVLTDNYVEEFIRQTERGVTKRSANPNLNNSHIQQIFQAAIENKGDRSAFEKQIMRLQIPTQLVGAFDLDDLEGRLFNQNPAGYQGPLNQYIESEASPYVKGIVEEAINIGAFSQADKAASDGAKVRMANELGKVVDAMPLGAFLSPVINDKFFGFSSSNRGFDVADLDSKTYSPEAKKAMLDLKDKIDKKKAEAEANREVVLKDFVSTYGFNPEDTRLFNAGAGLMGKVENEILNANLTAEEKQKLHSEKYGAEHEAANLANPKMAELVNNTFLDLAKDDRNAAVGWVYFNGMNTNNTSGLRSLSTWKLTQYSDGPQGIYKATNYKTGEQIYSKQNPSNKANIIDVELNRDHPLYNQAYAYAQQRAIELVESGALDMADIDSEIETIIFGGEGTAISMSAKKGVVKPINWGSGLLRAKGEHVTASATTSANIVISGLKGIDSGNFDLAKDNISKLTQDFDQALGAKVLSDIQDKDLGTTSEAGYARVFATLTAQPAVHTNVNDFKTLDGRTATDLATDQFANRQAIERVKEIRKALSPITDQQVAEAKIFDNATKMARETIKSANPRGMSAFDFDETLIDEGENFILAKKDGQEVKISSKQWPIQGPKYAAEGWTFDFTDFVNVRGGVEGPLFTKFKDRLAKFGPENMYILTARPAEAATAIHGWLKSKGVEIPLENITGLGNSTGEAKALWMLEKFSEGYNDMYFVDDALPNVEAVKNVLDQLDIKSDVQQALRSANPNKDFNDMLERSKGVPSEETFNRVQARNKGKLSFFDRRKEFFVPPGAEDFEGLMYYNYGKGKQGDADAKFMKEQLYDPYNRADRELDLYKQTLRQDMQSIKKQFPELTKRFTKDFAGGDYTVEQAMRIYLFDKNGYSVPGISEAEQKRIAGSVALDAEMVQFATLAERALKLDNYLEPTLGWNASSFNGDMADAAKIKRGEFMQEFNDNADIIFSEENLNKLEAVHGTPYREALEDILARMKSGTNRPTIKDKRVNAFLDWTNGSVGAIMFFNGRSAVLQTLSTVNFINFQDNNIFAAGKAFANQKQYWSDFSFLFNSPMLKQRRGGLQSDLNASELQRLAEQGGAKAVLGKILQLGFTPTQIADSFAIAAGGSTFYRNRINTYLKQGLDQKAAETKAFEDFQEIAEKTQQSSRPDKISQQQASVLGRLILAFQNTPMQYNRIIKKSAMDLVAGRGDAKSNISKILYYGAMQNLIFSSLQNALFAVAFDDDEDEEFLDKKTTRIANSTIDTLLRGSGITGAVIATVKNTIMKFIEEREKGKKDIAGRVLVESLQISPPIGSKARKLYGSITTDMWNKDVYKEIPLYNIDNPIWDAVGNTVEATTNAPLGRVQRKLSNLKAASDSQNAAWQRLALALGWDKWSLGVDRPEEIEEAKKSVKEKKKEETLTTFIDEQNKEKQEGKKDITCAAANKNGERCGLPTVDGTYCTIHARVEKREDNKKVQCKKIKSDGSRCKMQTNAKSGLCYYHD